MRAEKLKTSIDEMLILNDVDANGKLTLLELKKQVDQASEANCEDITNLEIYAFLIDYQNKIAKWLHTTEMVVQHKLKHKDFSSIEMKLIVTNILADQFTSQRINELD